MRSGYMFHTFPYFCSTLLPLFVPHSCHYLFHTFATLCSTLFPLFVPHFCSTLLPLFVPHFSILLFHTFATLCSTLLPLLPLAPWRPSQGNFGTWQRREAPPAGRQAFCQFFARNSQARTNLPLPHTTSATLHMFGVICLAWPGMAWHGMAWPGGAWHGATLTLGQIGKILWSR